MGMCVCVCVSQTKHWESIEACVASGHDQEETRDRNWEEREAQINRHRKRQETQKNSTFSFNFSMFVLFFNSEVIIKLLLNTILDVWWYFISYHLYHIDVVLRKCLLWGHFKIAAQYLFIFLKRTSHCISLAEKTQGYQTAWSHTNTIHTNTQNRWGPKGCLPGRRIPGTPWRQSREKWRGQHWRGRGGGGFFSAYTYSY